jgi:hypothetical protein
MFANLLHTGCVFCCRHGSFFRIADLHLPVHSVTAALLRKRIKENIRENLLIRFWQFLTLSLSLCLSVSLSLSLSHTHNYSFKRCKTYAGKFAIFCTYGELDKWELIPETFVIFFFLTVTSSKTDVNDFRKQRSKSWITVMKSLTRFSVRDTAHSAAVHNVPYVYNCKEQMTKTFPKKVGLRQLYTLRLRKQVGRRNDLPIQRLNSTFRCNLWA